MQNVNGALQGPFLAYDAPGPDLSMHNNLAGTGIAYGTRFHTSRLPKVL